MITEPETEQPDGIEEKRELPKLTPKAYQFAVNIALKGMNQYKAYVDAYDAGGWKRRSVDVEACNLRKSPKVSAWIDHLRIKGAMLSREAHMAELDNLKALALKMGNASAAITAENLRGKVSRLYVDSVEISDARKTTAAELAKMAAGGDADLAAKLLAQIDGVPDRVH